METTRRLAPQRLAEEDARLAVRLLRARAGGTLADLGCGYGRHLQPLAALHRGALVGVDRSALLLRAARSEAPKAILARADLRALPFAGAALDGAVCFYSSMFLGSEEEAIAALREAARVLKPSARLVLTTDNPLRLAAEPRQSFTADVPGLGRVSEEGRFDAARNVDSVTRQLELPSGRSLSATFSIRYYVPAELAALSRVAGLRLVELDPVDLSASAPQLVAVLEPQETPGRGSAS